MICAPIRRLGLLAAFFTLGASALATSGIQQIKIDRALNSPTLAVKYNGVHAALIELRLNGESFGTRTMDDTPTVGETTFSLDVLALKDGDNEVEIRLYDKAGHVVGSEKTIIQADSDKKGPVFLSTPKVGENVMGPVEISVGFGRDFKNSYVSFFVDNQFKAMMNIPPYTYNWDTTREVNGWHELEAWVVDDTSSTYKTRKVRIYVNNPGGHTYRPVTPPATTVTTTITKPLPKPVAKTQGPITPVLTATHAAAIVKTAAAPIDFVAMASANAVLSHLENQSSSGAKPAPIQASTAVGPRLMTPTGKRLITMQTVTVPVAPKPTLQTVEMPKTAIQTIKPTTAPPKVTTTTQPAVVISKPVQAPVVKSAPVTTTPAVTTTAPVTVQPVKLTPVAPQSPDDSGQEVALLPNAQPEPAVTTPHPVMDMTSENLTRPTTVGSEPSRPIVESTPVPSVPTVVIAPATIVKPAPAKPASHMLSVDYGTRFPMNAPYSIVLNGQPLSFDVMPTVLDGVPVAPFRHLIEKSGGEVTWQGSAHEITATTDGRDIWLKIGDKYAKVNSLAVELELAPFLQGGRTIIPLSFLKSALNVDIDYDKATNHVLITAKK